MACDATPVPVVGASDPTAAVVPPCSSRDDPDTATTPAAAAPAAVVPVAVVVAGAVEGSIANPLTVPLLRSTVDGRSTNPVHPAGTGLPAVTAATAHAGTCTR